MKRLLSLIAFTAILIYKFSLGFYTLYGVTKSYNEYFCTQRRADNPDYYFSTDSLALNLTKLPGLMGFDNISYIVGINGKPHAFGIKDDFVYNSTTNASWVENTNFIKILESQFAFSYKKGNNYHKISCTTENRAFVDRGPYSYISVSSYVNFDDSGYMRSQAISRDYRFLMNKPNYVVSWSKFTCSNEKSPETCNLKQETSDNFYLVYVITCCLLVSFCLLCFVNINDMLLMRIVEIFKIAASKMEMPRFCNPISGESVYLKRGDFVHRLVFDGGENLMQEDNLMLDSFKDLKGSYQFITKQKIMVKLARSKGYVLHLDATQSNMVKRYFFRVSMDENECVINDEENHYLSTEDVLNKVSMGMYIKRVNKHVSGHVLSINSLDLEFLKKIFPIKAAILKRLIQHNGDFFGVYNSGPLVKCLKGQMSFWKRPSNVKNSQWKWYCSDFCHIMNENGYNFRSEVKWRPSKALLALEEDIEVIKVDNEIHVFEDVCLGIKGGVLEKVAFDCFRSNLAEEIMPLEIKLDRKADEYTEEVESFVEETNQVIKEASSFNVDMLKPEKCRTVDKLKENLDLHVDKKKELIRCLNEKFILNKRLIYEPPQVTKTIKKRPVCTPHKSNALAVNCKDKIVGSMVTSLRQCISTKNSFEILRKVIDEDKKPRKPINVEVSTIELYEESVKLYADKKKKQVTKKGKGKKVKSKSIPEAIITPKPLLGRCLGDSIRKAVEYYKGEKACVGERNNAIDKGRKKPIYIVLRVLKKMLKEKVRKAELEAEESAGNYLIYRTVECQKFFLEHDNRGRPIRVDKKQVIDWLHSVDIELAPDLMSEILNKFR